jgi:hypothetical protein
MLLFSPLSTRCGCGQSRLASGVSIACSTKEQAKPTLVAYDYHPKPEFWTLVQLNGLAKWKFWREPFPYWATHGPVASSAPRCAYVIAMIGEDPVAMLVYRCTAVVEFSLTACSLLSFKPSLITCHQCTVEDHRFPSNACSCVSAAHVERGS